MKKNYFLRGWNIILLVIICAFIFSTNLYGQSFSQSNLNFNGKGSISNGTSLMFGPDGRLYVAEYTGAIKIFTIQRTSGTDYKVLESEVLSDIASIQDHNDDGSLYSTTLRETTGLTVGGTATNPVIYVASSDFRIGGGGGGGSGDTNLDTNSGIITRFSWNGSSWDVVDIVRGLPRSEENHATNGMELATINGVNYLIVAQGGHTNAGAPSINFAYTTEYALSAAILSVNLDMINSLPIKTDNGRKYLYDLPTLDDPTRPNKNGITNPDIVGYNGVDINDPFGGNDGLNQAKIVPGGPVQIFSPGFRNCYDLVLTEAGAVYVTENGSNGGWGGFPVNEGGGNATNDYDPNEPGSTVSSGGEKVNNLDHLQLITPNIQNYSFGSFYGGHPTPVRANPFGAGLFTNPSKNGTTGAIFRTKKYHPTKNTGDFTNDPTIGLPADWPPVAVANPVEGDWRGPGIPNPDGPVDDIITTWGTNTNGIDEYTASNFNGAMKGNLIAGVNTGVLRRVELKPDGSLSKLTPSFVSGLGGDALGVTCNSDNDIFPGTIWVVTLNGKLIVLEPQDFGECKLPGDPGYDANADYDFDGYTNQDEEDNGTDPCNGGSQPNDFDKSNNGPNVSDLNDLDDDADGILDENDPFQLGDPQESGSDAFLLPVINELFSSNTELGGYKGLGLTGIMNNGMPNPNWLNWLDRRDDPNDPNDNDILGGAIGAMTMQMTSGTAFGSSNSQEKAFQYGVQVNSNSGVFTVEGGIANFSGPVQLYGSNSSSNGELGFFIGDGTQSNYIKFVITPNGLVALQEVNDIPQTPININIPVLERPDSSISFYFVVNPSNGEVVLKYSFDAGVQVIAGIINAKGPILHSLQDANKGLAVGMIGTSNTVGVELEGTWDFLNVISDGPTIASELPDIERTVGVVTENISLLSYFDDNQGVENLTYSVSGNTNTAIGAIISGSTLIISYPDSPAVSAITIRATDVDSNFIEQSFNVSVIEEQVADEVLYRVNAGGPAITAIDGKLNWEQDTKANKSVYLTQAGNNNTYAGGMTSYNNEVDQATAPVSIYNTERYDSGSGAPNMTYAFPVDKAGMYEVRLYMGNSYSGTSAVGKRIFDISIEGVVNPSLDDIDLSNRFGHQVGGVIIKEVEVTDGLLEISFIHGAIENPLINGIEILGVASGVPNTPINVSAIEDQLNFEGDVLDGSLAVSASGGDGNLTYSISGAPSGVVIEPTNGQIGGTISSGTAANSPYTVTVTVDDSDAETNDAVALSFNWEIKSGIPIEVSAIEDQVNFEGDALNGSLAVSASGGDGNLTYSISGAPSGVVIEPTNGQIGGTINSGTAANSPYTVTVTVDDSDTETSDAVEISFNWEINSGSPTIASELPDIERTIGVVTENISLLSYFGDNQGVENLTYSISGNTNTAIGAIISGSTLTISYPDSPAVSAITIRATDADSNFIEQSFSVSVIEEQVADEVLYRVNAGGPAITAIDGKLNWEQDTKANKSIYLTQAGNNNTYAGGMTSYNNEVDQATTPVSIYNTERYDSGSGAPNMTYAFPVDKAGMYEVRLYMGNSYSGTSAVGKRIFDISIEGVVNPSLDDIDLSNRFGHQVGGVIIKEVEVTDGLLEISFIHGAIENPLINGIEILGVASGAPNTPISVSAIEDQLNFEGDVLDGSLAVSASGGDGNLTYSISGAPAGVIIEPTNGQISGTISSGTAVNSPYPVTVTVDDSDTETSDAVELSFNWEIKSGTPIEVVAIEDQVNFEGDALDGSLAVSASGGDGNLTYSISGAPSGVFIEPTNGQIGGTINSGTAANSPYTVTVTVDDSDAETSDAVALSFNWEINSGSPTIASELPDIERTVGVVTENISLLSYFEDNQGVENLTYSVSGNTNTAIGAIISGSTLTISYPDSPAVSAITIRATDADSNFIEQSFNVSVIEEQVADEVLYRVNAGGPAITAIDGKLDWEQDTRTNKSLYLTQAGNNNTYSGGMTSYNNEVDQATTPVSIYNTERYDSGSGAPNMTYAFPVDKAGMYEVRLYMGNSYSGTSAVGKRIFDISIEGVVNPSLDDIDLSSRFGHQVGGVIIKEVEVTDGLLEISFIHGAIENPLINGIEILGVASGAPNTPINVSAIEDQVNFEGDVLDGSLAVSASGGDGNLTYSISGAPAGVIIEPANGQIGGTINSSTATNSPYPVTITVDDSDAETNDAVELSFNWEVSESIEKWTLKNESENYTARHECSFVQAGDKFYLLGGRENAKTVDIYDYSSNTWTSLSGSLPFEFNHFQAVEYQGLIWVIGAFGDNGFPTEVPEEFIWIFNPATKEWIKGPEIPSERQRGSAGLVVYNDKFYIVGGNSDGHNGGAVAWFDEFDPATGSWTPLVNAPRARDHFHAALVGDNLYAIGGRLSGGNGGTFKPVIPEVDVYNFSTATWSTLPSNKNLPTPRAAASVVNYDEKLLVIGGEVDNEIVYGENISGALKITEEYDPITGSWERMENLNYERHGTQAIVSGMGVFTLSGSPKLGGGNQKNMEYLGVDEPIGILSIESSLIVPSSLQVPKDSGSQVSISVTGGNIGKIITSMEITGPNKENFVITSGNLIHGLLKPNNNHNVHLNFLGDTANETANLVIYYDSGAIETVALQGNLTNTLKSSISSVAMYPNPTAYDVTIQISDPELIVEEIYVYNYSGVLSRTYTFPEKEESGIYNFDVATLPSGVYIVKLKTNQSKYINLNLIVKR
ncbi:putative Ig domain-containing protein [Salegentibacter mishustinae]|uniref:malectin domain-containing carbohydrate-binding protein n=1 Tax=Salegentibacter mishustinae TaxID=270918 RepID=UPI001CE16B20|nr:malectin domain-containing carbohydrate-binding protein [Salegentibacter mishustinae]UBZ06270.1 putative Ig domain-containing protein [Salegentibacter mishustinae]